MGLQQCCYSYSSLSSCQLHRDAKGEKQSLAPPLNGRIRDKGDVDERANKVQFTIQTSINSLSSKQAILYALAKLAYVLLCFNNSKLAPVPWHNI